MNLFCGRYLNLVLLAIFANFLVLNSPVFAATGKVAGGVVKISDTHKLIVATMEGDVQKKASLINELIESLPADRELIIVVEPSVANKEKHTLFKSKIQAAVDKATAEKNLKVNVKFVNSEVAAEAGLLFNAEAPDADIYFNKPDNRVLEDAGLLYVENVPQNFVMKLERSTNWANFTSSIGDFGYVLADQGRKVSFSGLVIATVATYVGFETFFPTYVYVSNGEMSQAAMLSMAMSTAVLYTVPRHEGIIKKFHELTYEWFRSGWNLSRRLVNGAKNLWSKENASHFYMTNQTRAGQLTSQTVIAAFGLLPFQALAYTLQDGTGVLSNPEYVEFMIRNSIIIGAASAPWTFATDKLKEETNISTNTMTHLRTVQLLGLGVLAASGIPYGMEATWYSLTPQEMAMFAIGGLGLAAHKYGVKVINKLDRSRWYHYINDNLEAITNAPSKAFWNMFRRGTGRGRPLRYGFKSLSTITADLENQYRCGEFLTNH